MSLRSTYLRGGTFRLAEAGTSTGTVTDGDTYLPAAGFWLNLDGCVGAEVVTNRQSDVGTCTMNVFVEEYNPATNAYTASQDAAGNDISGVEYTDGQTGERVIRMHPSPIAVDADGVLIVDTVDKWFQASPPRKMRLRVRSGGTSVANVFSMIVRPLS